VKVVGLLSWFQESPAWLAGCVASLDGIVDHLVAVDGAYFLYPNSVVKWRSDRLQAETIRETATSLNIGLTLFVPNGPFMGGEVEKRNLTFRLAETVTTEDDWLFAIDGDELVSYECGFRDELEKTENLACNIGLRNTVDPLALPDRLRQQLVRNEMVLEGIQPSRSVYRALRGLRYEGAHYVITADTEDGKTYLWGNSRYHTFVDAADLASNLVVDHRLDRTRERDRDRREYYRLRDELGIEAITQ
jgi:hypothetical protein